MLNALNFGTPVRLIDLAANPADPENGLLYYNSTDDRYVVYIAGAFDYLAKGSELDTLEVSMGSAINGDGSFNSSAFTSATFIDDAVSFTDAFLQLDSAIGSISVSMQDAYDGGNDIVTLASTPVNVTGPAGIRSTLLELHDESASGVMQREYVDGINLAVGGPTVISELSNDEAAYPAIIVNYSIIGVDLHRRVGRLLVTWEATTNTTSLSEDFADTGDVGIAFTATRSGGDLQISSENTSGVAATMNVEIVRFPA
jgi:hypothetical protein